MDAQSPSATGDAGAGSPSPLNPEPSAGVTPASDPGSTPPIAGEPREDIEAVRVRERIRAHAQQEAILNRVLKGILLQTLREAGGVRVFGKELFTDEALALESAKLDPTPDGGWTATLINNEEFRKLIATDEVLAEEQEQERREIDALMEAERREDEARYAEADRLAAEGVSKAQAKLDKAVADVTTISEVTRFSNDQEEIQ